MMKERDDRFNDSMKVQAIVHLWLFLWVRTWEMYDISLRLNAHDSRESVDFADRFVVIVNHERVIWSMLEKIQTIDQKRVVSAHLDSRQSHQIDLNLCSRVADKIAQRNSWRQLEKTTWSSRETCNARQNYSCHRRYYLSRQSRSDLLRSIRRAYDNKDLRTHLHIGIFPIYAYCSLSRSDLHCSLCTWRNLEDLWRLWPLQIRQDIWSLHSLTFLLCVHLLCFLSFFPHQLHCETQYLCKHRRLIQTSVYRILTRREQRVEKYWRWNRLSSDQEWNI